LHGDQVQPYRRDTISDRKIVVSQESLTIDSGFGSLPPMR
jgi:hypothetical protein